MIVVTVKVDWGQETIQEILPELKKHVEITLEEPGCDEQTKENKRVSHLQKRSSASLDAASFAFAEEKRLIDQSSRACFVSDAS